MNKAEKELAKKVLDFYNSPSKTKAGFTREENIILERWRVQKIINEEAFADITSLNSDHREYIQVLGYPFTPKGEEDLQKMDQNLEISPIFGKPDKKYCYDLFVLMPFIATLKPIYDDHIKKVAETLNLSVARADDFFSQNSIMHEVWSAISLAKILIADCTGKNPNVFYEIGLAHAIGKPVVLITQNADDVPFDLRHRRYILYAYTPPGMKIFENMLSSTISETLKDFGFLE